MKKLSDYEVIMSHDASDVFVPLMEESIDFDSAKARFVKADLEIEDKFNRILCLENIPTQHRDLLSRLKKLMIVEMISEIDDPNVFEVSIVN